MMDWGDLNDAIVAFVQTAVAWGSAPWFYLQIGMILVAAGVAQICAALIRARVDVTTVAAAWPAPLRLFTRILLGNVGLAIFALIAILARHGIIAAEWSVGGYLLRVAAALALAWLLIRFATGFIRNQFIVRVVSVAAWLVAALSVIGVLDRVLDALDSISVVIGGTRLTLLLLIKFAIFLTLALWISGLISNFLEIRITRSRDLTPSVQVLLTKLVRVVLMVFAVVLVMGAVGINLQALAVFTGAIGVGVGIGLQKIVANFISGVILLADKSVKPGDLVTVGDSSGRISAMNARYVTVAAGDGREILIPNEDLITQKVVNMTYSSLDTLVKVPFSTNYDADPKIVCKLAIEVASAIPRVESGRPPGCLITEFADHGMKFMLTFWVADPYAGTDNVKSDVMTALWEAFKRADIRVPYPVRELRVRSKLPIDAVIETPES